MQSVSQLEDSMVIIQPAEVSSHYSVFSQNFFLKNKEAADHSGRVV
jgi:hypothetical protein